ncbi:MAG: hypothetical protein JXA74_11355 [Anaerolineae bacterium]|nr:hypothetical protein [Anaerolineae bacterium]
MLSKGMLWFDDSSGRSLAHKVEQAAHYYQTKYGAPPNVCYVHPSCLSDESPSLETIKILASGYVLPHHFWIGVLPAQ